MHRRTVLAAVAAGSAGLAWTPLRAAPPAAAAPRMTVFKSPSCGCCAAWVDHVRAAGFAVDVTETDDLSPIKAMAGVPPAAQSCHTAAVGGYVVEGHVPADVVRRLLAEAPAVRGLAVPGMPVGSPGMEGPGAAPYAVRTIVDGRLGGVFATVVP